MRGRRRLPEPGQTALGAGRRPWTRDQAARHARSCGIFRAVPANIGTAAFVTPRPGVQLLLRFLLKCTLLLAALCAALPPSWAQSADRSPRLALADCRIEDSERIRSLPAKCAELEVAEDRSSPGSPRIRLKVAVIPALDRSGPRDPLFVLAGGPGQAATDFYVSAAPAFARVQRERDIVLVDQRGTGGSNALACEYPEEDELAEMSPAEIRRLAQQCLAALKSDPRHYTTSVAIRDLDEVRAALGYEQINLYGVSYGTRVAQHYLRRFPDHVRAAILDGVVPPGLVLVADSSLQAQRALDLIFQRCRADAECHAAFPDPAATFDTLRTRLRDQPAIVSIPDPVTGEVAHETVRAIHLQIAARFLSYAPERAALLPLLLHEAAERNNLAPLAAQAELFATRYASSLSIGMHNAVVCAEDAPLLEPARIDRRALERTYLGTLQLDGLVEICKVWPRGSIDPDFHAALASAVPVLLLSGSADPVTPPSYAESARRALSESLHVVIEGQGHGQLGVGCVPRLLADFLERGTTHELDVSCTRTISPAPFFTSFAGPPP
jgi:pimeloyl-ACP methyl ester carboxylesterase